MRVLRDATSNPYCVPAALSALTGRHVDEVLILLKDYLGDQPVSGIYYPIALAILQKLGYQYKEVQRISTTGTFLCFTKTHAFVVSNGVYFDNNCPNGATGFRIPRVKPVAKYRIPLKAFQIFSWSETHATTR